MVGCFAIADPSQIIRTDLDNELEGMFSGHYPLKELTSEHAPMGDKDARWFTRDEGAC